MTDTLVPVFDLGGVFVDWDPMLPLPQALRDRGGGAVVQGQRLHARLEPRVRRRRNLCRGRRQADHAIPALLARNPGLRPALEGDLRRDHRGHGRDPRRADRRRDPDLRHHQLLVGEVDDDACREWPFLEKFDGVIVSGLEKLVKPDPRIYRVFCERYGLAPESCVFIDDSEPNVISARKMRDEHDPLRRPRAMPGRADQLRVSAESPSACRTCGRRRRRGRGRCSPSR